MLFAGLFFQSNDAGVGQTGPAPERAPISRLSLLSAVTHIVPAPRLLLLPQLRGLPSQWLQFLRLGLDRLPQLPVLLLQLRRPLFRHLPRTISCAVPGDNPGPITYDIPGVAELRQQLAHPPGKPAVTAGA